MCASFSTRVTVSLHLPHHLCCFLFFFKVRESQAPFHGSDVEHMYVVAICMQPQPVGMQQHHGHAPAPLAVPASRGVPPPMVGSAGVRGRGPVMNAPPPPIPPQQPRMGAGPMKPIPPQSRMMPMHMAPHDHMAPAPAPPHSSYTGLALEC
jgi:hypothetical protein